MKVIIDNVAELKIGRPKRHDRMLGRTKKFPYHRTIKITTGSGDVLSIDLNSWTAEGIEGKPSTRRERK